MSPAGRSGGCRARRLRRAASGPPRQLQIAIPGLADHPRPAPSTSPPSRLPCSAAGRSTPTSSTPIQPRRLSGIPRARSARRSRIAVDRRERERRRRPRRPSLDTRSTRSTSAADDAIKQNPTPCPSSARGPDQPFLAEIQLLKPLRRRSVRHSGTPPRSQSSTTGRSSRPATRAPEPTDAIRNLVKTTSWMSCGFRSGSQPRSFCRGSETSVSQRYLHASISRIDITLRTSTSTASPLFVAAPSNLRARRRRCSARRPRQESTSALKISKSSSITRIGSDPKIDLADFRLEPEELRDAPFPFSRPGTRIATRSPGAFRPAA